MLFTDDESRHKFHKSATFLQMICTILENEMSRHHIQLELIDTDYDEEAKVTRAYIIVADADFEERTDKQKAFKSVAKDVRQRFTGKIVIEPGNYGFLTVQLKDTDLNNSCQLN